MKTNIVQPKTQAEKWLKALMEKTNAVDTSKQSSQKRINLIIAGLKQQYPHQAFVLTGSNVRIGIRLVFTDRSYVDQMDANLGSGMMTCGTMTNGVLGKKDGVAIH